MAPRKAAPPMNAAAPARPDIRRSARLNAAQALQAPAPDANKRVTKAKAPVKRKSSRKECTICSRKLAASSYSRLPLTDNCKHDITTCNSCIGTHIVYQLDSVTYDQISCPECPEILQNATIKRLGGEKAHRRYEELYRKSIAEKTPGWRWCLNPHCMAGQVHKPLVVDPTASEPTQPEVDPEEKPRAQKRKAYIARKKTNATDEAEEDASSDDICTCHDCGARACVPCDRPYHEGETCAQIKERFREQNENEIKASEETIAKNCRKCPNEKCGKNIEKNGGCDQMYCTQCKTSFCWLCGALYSHINRKGHNEGCLYSKSGAFDPHAAPNAPGNAVFNFQFGGPNVAPPPRRAFPGAGPPPLPVRPRFALPPGLHARAGQLGLPAGHFIGGPIGGGGGGGGGTGGAGVADGADGAGGADDADGADGAGGGHVA
ncbi:hypothetical protein EJ03DRAFT_381883 [Teratosphaeria nubilosa]|uniref:RBR-type E3 ubiquitin transferase n=1 Tax=Teratosphaeria nubilosa TaxID=161662 RepID=A0A6G1LCH9_9PEZI|nr:hypothetical protein EJ03DRAFT_381883 [Teratosphaeria nubilosa]